MVYLLATEFYLIMKSPRKETFVTRIMLSYFAKKVG